MASDAVYTQLQTMYPNGTMPVKEQDVFFEAIVRDMENRSYGNYPRRPELGYIDNLELVDRGLNKSPMMPPSARGRFLRAYWPRIRDAEYRFYSIQDFLTFHLPFAEKFATTATTLKLEGPEDEPEIFGKHVTCDIIKGRRQGCDICELLALLEAHLDDGNPAKPLARKIKTEKSFQLAIAGTMLHIRGTVSDGLVRSLVVEGYVHLLAWSSFRSRSALRDVSKDSTPPALDPVEEAQHGSKGRADSPRDEQPEPQLICFHDVGRPGFRHCQNETGCWEMSVQA